MSRLIEKTVSWTKCLCRHVAVAISAALAGLAVGQARGEIFVLKGAGEVRGELTNRDESPRKTYVIKTASGGQITLAAGQVLEVKKQTPAEMQYDRIRGLAPDTVEGQWKLAEWCRENRLAQQRKTHLERILEIDSNHEQARHGLGYTQIGGRWVTQEQRMIESGYVRSKVVPGKWVLPQEEELLTQQNKSSKAQLDWHAKLKRWSTWLGGEKGAEAAANIKAINDPYAVSALVKFLENDRRRNARLLYVEALGRINAPQGMDALVQATVFEPDEEIRLAALEEVVARNYKPAVAQYVRALKHKENAVINLAAIGLGRMKDQSAIGPLIDVLVTTHTFRIQRGQPGQTTTTFGTGPNSGAFSMGGSRVEIIKRQFENRAVLQALVELTGGVSYNFDVPAWKNWYAAQKKTQTIDARRDSPQ
jgi:hypothetical protein